MPRTACASASARRCASLSRQLFPSAQRPFDRDQRSGAALCCPQAGQKPARLVLAPEQRHSGMLGSWREHGETMAPIVARGPSAASENDPERATEIVALHPDHHPEPRAQTRPDFARFLVPSQSRVRLNPAQSLEHPADRSVRQRREPQERRRPIAAQPTRCPRIRGAPFRRAEREQHDRSALAGVSETAAEPLRARSVTALHIVDDHERAVRISWHGQRSALRVRQPQLQHPCSVAAGSAGDLEQQAAAADAGRALDDEQPAAPVPGVTDRREDPADLPVALQQREALRSTALVSGSGHVVQHISAAAQHAQWTAGRGFW